MSVYKHARDATKEVLSKDRHLTSPKGINCGEGTHNCEDWYFAFRNRVPDAKKKEGPGHVFAEHKGKYYDSEHPEGVSHPNDLSHFKRADPSDKWEEGRPMWGYSGFAYK